jgi:putative transposase
LEGFDYRGACVYALTYCTHRRRPLFVQPRVIRVVAGEITRTAGEQRFVVLACVFMSDHLHLLVQGQQEDAHLTSFAKVSRQRSSLNVRAAGVVRLWQDGYYERTLRRDEDCVTVARYIANSPVRAGLVAQPHDWPYSGGVLVDALFERGRVISSCNSGPQLKLRPTYEPDQPDQPDQPEPT